MAVQKRLESRKLNFYVAKVDCSIDEGFIFWIALHLIIIEFCDSKSIDAYPTLYYYKKGVFIEEYHGELRAKEVYKYIKSILKRENELHQDL